MSDQVDEVTLYRQMRCTHSFIKHMLDPEKICTLCGVSEAKSVKLRERAMWAALGGMTGGFTP